MAYRMTEQTLNWDGVSVSARTSGQGNAMILLHSLGGQSDHWQFVQPTLAEAGFCVTALDLPGHGNSGLPESNFTPRWMGEALARSLDRPAILVGNSLGGWVALRAYLSRPEMVLGICLVASAGLKGMPTRPPKMRLNPGQNNLLDTLLQAVFFAPQHILPTAREALMRGIFTPALLKLVPDGLLYPADLMEIQCPISIIWGEEDQILPVTWADQFARSLPFYKKLVIPQCGHLPQLEHPERFNRELLAFAKVFQ